MFLAHHRSNFLVCFFSTGHGSRGKVVLVCKGNTGLQQDVSSLDIITFLCPCCVVMNAKHSKEEQESLSVGINREFYPCGNDGKEEGVR